MDRIRAMETFIQIVDRGSMSRAAAAMGVSATTVSAYLAFLEGHLGRRLLDRSTRRIDLTREGRRFLEEARHIVAAVVAAEDAGGNAGQPRGSVRIDAPAAIGRHLLLPALPAFMTRYPEVQVEISLGDRASNFRLDGFDILLRAGAVQASSADCHLLGSTRFVHVASPDYLARRGEPVLPKDLESHDCILYTTIEQPGGRWWSFEQAGRFERIRPPATLSLNDGSAIADAAKAGLGIARTLALLVHRDIAEGRLVPVLESYCLAPIAIHAMSAQDRDMLPPVAAMLGFLADMNWSDDLYPGPSTNHVA